MARRKASETEAPADPVEAPVPAAATPFVIEEPAEAAMPEPEPPEPSVTTPPPQPAPPRRSGFLGAVSGGVLAALGGFALSHFNVLGFAPPDQTAALAALENRLNEALAAAEADRAALGAVQGELAPLADRLAALEAAPPPSPPDLSALDDLERRLAAIEAMPEGGDASTAALAAKLAELERRIEALPQGVDQARVDAALARLEAAEAEAMRRADEASRAAEAAARAEALDRLRAAVAAGAGFEAELAAVDDPALAAALGPHVAGVATLADLQAAFPEAARRALELARQGSEAEGWGERLADFLAAQTGARSLTPREGDSPDAILSRAEFALSEGRLADALAELGTLDEALRAPFADWIARAEARRAVDMALEGR